jgi:diphthine-ammonia ligase
MEQAFASWSGGKDGCMACYLASIGGLKIRYLLNMVTEDGRMSWSHGMAARWLDMQSKAIDIPLVQKRTKQADYEAAFTDTLIDFKREGITAGVFGDIDFNAHKEWIDMVCAAGGITPHLPLWLMEQNKIMKDFVGLGFETIVVSTNSELLGEEWVGRRIDRDFISDIGKLKNVTPCGESGEYHTMVVDGPIFKKRLEVVKADKVLRDKRWFYEITDCELKPKRGK